MNFKQLSIEISKLILKYDNSEEWIREKKVFNWWNVLFFSTFIYLILSFLLFFISEGAFPNSKLFSLFMRIFLTTSLTFLLCVLIILSFRYYVFLLSKSKDLRFTNIIFFYGMSLFIFTALYKSIYSLYPSSFNYLNPPFIVTEIVKTDLNNIIMSLDFFIYSALTNFTFNYYKITSASVYISLINIIQIIYSIILITVFIGTFIQKLYGFKK